MDDPYLWLEDVEGETALAWVRAHNASTQARLEKNPVFKPIHEEAVAILNSDARIPYVTRRGDFLYNFWQDDVHVRGIWRRTSLDAYRRDVIDWEVLLDIDALSKAENENWVFKGAQGLGPKYERCLVGLSRGGSDASAYREFDLVRGDFIVNGFHLPPAKSNVTWIDADRVLVATDFGPGTLTDSGYARIVKLWRRGTSLDDAQTLFIADSHDVSASGMSIKTRGGRLNFIYHGKTFYSRDYYFLDGDKLVPLRLPEDASISGFLDPYLIVFIRSDWRVNKTKVPAGSLVSLNFNAWLKGHHQVAVIAAESEHTSIEDATVVGDQVAIAFLTDVKSELQLARPQEDGDRVEWTHTHIALPEAGSTYLVAADPDHDDFFLNYASFLHPDTLYHVNERGTTLEPLKQLPGFFDATGYTVNQRFATSKDGTQIPYFVVSPQDFTLDGHHPTLLYGYGGFEVSLTPSYSPLIATAWLQRGGVYVLANIRGGGEYGPKWHRAALKYHRLRAYEDFIAVAEDLVKTQVTSSEHLGIMGGSNGGLLVGVALTQRPDLFKAVVCQVPLLDMHRYHLLLAGASWIGEYGDPNDPDMWNYIKTYSPYHNLQAGVAYPRVFFRTSTKDDRVHPGHARKMAAKMEAMGLPIFYYENIEGGHAGSTTQSQRAYAAALEYSYLWMTLGH